MSNGSGEEYQNAVEKNVGPFRGAFSKVDDSF